MKRFPWRWGDDTPRGDRSTTPIRAIGIGGVLVALALASHAPVARAQGVFVGLSPETVVVMPNEEFELDIESTAAGLPFNAYDAVVTYDQAALSFVPMSPLDLQQGSYMTNACGSTFQRFTPGPDTLAISHSLLCSNVSLTGPGQLYRLRFRAGETPGTTAVRLRRVQFYNAGLYVDPEHTTDAVVVIAGATSVTPVPARSAIVMLEPPRPNPTRGVVSADFVVGRATSVRIGVWDTQGRRVALLAQGPLPTGRHRATWDGTHEGARLQAGVYFLRVEAAGQQWVRRLVLRD